MKLITVDENKSGVEALQEASDMIDAEFGIKRIDLSKKDYSKDLITKEAYVKNVKTLRKRINDAIDSVIKDPKKFIDAHDKGDTVNERRFNILSELESVCIEVAFNWSDECEKYPTEDPEDYANEENKDDPHTNHKGIITERKFINKANSMRKYLNEVLDENINNPQGEIDSIEHEGLSREEHHDSCYQCVYYDVYNTLGRWAENNYMNGNF